MTAAAYESILLLVRDSPTAFYWESLRGQCHEIFFQKVLPRPHLNRQNGLAKFFVFAKIFAGKLFILFYSTFEKKTINVTKQFAKPFSLFIWGPGRIF